jgi:predicted nucleotidyltransferase
MNAHEIVVQEVDRHHVRVVVLFGSRARCDARKDSDYDIAVFIACHVT